MNARSLVTVGDDPAFHDWVAAIMGAVSPSPGRVSPHELDALLEAGLGPATVVVAPSVPQDAAVSLAQEVTKRAPASVVILARDRPAVNGLLPAAMRAGARDVVDLSGGSLELQEALHRADEWLGGLLASAGTEEGSATDRGRLVCVFSSKGGTGKTFLTANLGVAIARDTGRDCAIVDLDHDMGDLFAYFGRHATRPFEDLLTVGPAGNRASITAAGEKLDEHLWGYAGRTDPAAGPVSGEAMSAFLDVLRSAFATTVLDATTEYADHVLTALEAADEICLVVGMDVVGVRHLATTLETLAALDVPRERLRVVLNRADPRIGLDRGDVEGILKLKVDALLPSSPAATAALNRGEPLMRSDARSELARSVRALAAGLAGAGSREATPRRRFLSRRG